MSTHTRVHQCFLTNTTGIRLARLFKQLPFIHNLHCVQSPKTFWNDRSWILQAGYPSCCPTSSINGVVTIYTILLWYHQLCSSSLWTAVSLLLASSRDYPFLTVLGSWKSKNPCTEFRQFFTGVRIVLLWSKTVAEKSFTNFSWFCTLLNIHVP